MPSKTQQIDKFNKKKKQTREAVCQQRHNRLANSRKKESERKKETREAVWYKSCVPTKTQEKIDSRRKEMKKKQKRSCDTEVVCQQTHKT